MFSAIFGLKSGFTSSPLIGKLSIEPLNCIISLDEEAAAALKEAKKDEPSILHKEKIIRFEFRSCCVFVF